MTSYRMIFGVFKCQKLIMCSKIADFTDILVKPSIYENF